MEKIVDFRELPKDIQLKTLANYELRLSKYTEIYTLTEEIKSAIYNDKNFYLYVVLFNNNPVGHIQFKYFESSRMIFIDYVYLLKDYSFLRDNFYSLLERNVIKKFDIANLVTEVTFFNKRRNKALELLLSKQGFYSLDFNYIQPPTESIFFTKGKLLIKPIKWYNEYDINLIIKDIYFNHYGFWYRKKRLYKYTLEIIYFIQKYYLKNYNLKNVLVKELKKLKEKEEKWNILPKI